MKRILITGSTGFLGTHCLKVFEKLRNYKIIGVSSKDYDLMKESQVVKMFKEIRPDYLVHLAARSGGIYSNRTEPADYYYKNIQLITMTFHYAYKYGVKKILIPMGGCSYPANAKSPINEEQMWEGFPQKESAGYSMAKKMALVQSWAYKQQYGFNSVVVIPGNMYGEYDNFVFNEAHVIPAMIRKLYEAKLNNIEKVNFWGTGKPKRDFVYAGDVAETFPYFLFDYNAEQPVNISRGAAISISEVANKISRILGYKGKVNWDASQPDGQLEKTFSIKKLRSLGLKCPTSLDKGLERTIKWFCKNYNNTKIRL